MSQLYVPGASALFVGTGGTIGAKTLQFLGYTAEGVDMNLHGNFAPIRSDVSGPMSDVDKQFFLENIDFTFRLVHYNEQVLQAFVARTWGGIAGNLSQNQNGGLIVTENLGFPFAIVCPYAVKAVFSATMVSGYYMPCVVATDPVSMPLSTRTKLPTVTVEAQAVYNTNTLSATLYSNTLPTIPSVN